MTHRLCRRVYLFAGFFLALFPYAASHAQGTSGSVVGWYNGDWKIAIPGADNWYVSATQFARTYDDFVVPYGGWTITGFMSNNTMSSTVVTQASWELRSGVSAGNAGMLIASGVSPAALTAAATNGPVVDYLVLVSGLSLALPAGQYWLSVAPVVSGSSYLCATLGLRSVGNPPGNDNAAFVFSAGPTGLTSVFPIQGSGQGGTSGAFSLGVMINGAPPPPGSLPWQADLNTLAQQMETLHSLPFPGISTVDFNTRVDNLVVNSPTLTDPQMRTAIQSLVASIGDPHTDVEWPYPSPSQFLPLTFYWFDDGMYIINAPAEYQNLLGGQLVSIDQSTTDRAVAALTPLVAHDNDSWLKYYLPATKLTNTDFLFGTGVSLATSSAQVQVQTASGDLASATVQAVNQYQYPPMLPVYQGDLPLYRQHPEKNYWSTVIDNGATVYFEYNTCTEDPNEPSADFLAQLNQTLAQPGVLRLIVDMRNNTGGSATILDPWIETIRSGPFNQAGHLYIIVGRATFSAAMEASDLLRDETAAIFVGEPTGGKPRFLLRRGDFPLPYYGLRTSYSSAVENALDPGPTLVPDIQTPVTFQNYMNGIDPAMDVILSTPAPPFQPAATLNSAADSRPPSPRASPRSRAAPR